MSYVFETPDGGKTVYRREVGKSHREMVSQDYDLHADLQETKLWGDIRRSCKTDPYLQELMDRVITYHLLKKNSP